jgi:class 3 adenylate cyclase
MPIYMDRHSLEGATAEALAAAHQKDLGVQSRYGCKCFTYWFDERRQSVFCLIEAPSRQAVQEMHQAAHGFLANQIIEVEASSINAFLGRLTDPQGVEHEPIRESAFRAIMFTDVANSTDITNRLGDDVAFELLREHQGLVRDTLREHGGREVDHAGDGFLSCFASVSHAVDCAISIQKAFRAFNKPERVAPVKLRIGLGAGEPVSEGDALFGSTVNLTARVCARALPEQILAAGVVRDLCIGRMYSFKDHGPVELKGFPGAVQLHEIQWQ